MRAALLWGDIHRTSSAPACLAAQVSSVRSTKEALQLLAPAASGAELPFDLILKEHEPPEVNACRLLRRLSRTELLAKIPVVCECRAPATSQECLRLVGFSARTC